MWTGSNQRIVPVYFQFELWHNDKPLVSSDFRDKPSPGFLVFFGDKDFLGQSTETSQLSVLTSNEIVLQLFESSSSRVSDLI